MTFFIHGILPTWRYSHMTFITPDIFIHDIDWHSSHMTFFTHDILHTWHSSHMTFFTHDILHTWHSSPMPFFTHAVLHTCRSPHMTFFTYDILLTWHSSRKTLHTWDTDMLEAWQFAFFTHDPLEYFASGSPAMIHLAYVCGDMSDIRTYVCYVMWCSSSMWRKNHGMACIEFLTSWLASPKAYHCFTHGASVLVMHEPMSYTNGLLCLFPGRPFGTPYRRKFDKLWTMLNCFREGWKHSTC